MTLSLSEKGMTCPTAGTYEITEAPGETNCKKRFRSVKLSPFSIYWISSMFPPGLKIACARWGTVANILIDFSSHASDDTSHATTSKRREIKKNSRDRWAKRASRTSFWRSAVSSVGGLKDNSLRTVPIHRCSALPYL